MLISSSNRYARENIETNRVYDSIKTLIIEHALPVGKRILVEPLADELNVSNTPVREALIQLASEWLIKDEPNAGFFTKEISELEVRNLYILNQNLLELSLSLVRNDGQVPGMLKPPNFFDESQQGVTNSPESKVQILNALFVHIARQSGNSDVLKGIMNINDRTYFIRLHECEMLQGWQEDLLRLCQIYYQKNIEELRHALKVYHDKVIAFLPDLLLLLRRAQTEIRQSS
ncbi:MAG: GntR family transcriptional regulator [Emcibacter sp.]|nr:GntR family transcriptional regulator [Emcibacter sp.]